MPNVQPPAEAQWASVVMTAVVSAGEVIVWTPVNVLAASVLAIVADVVGNVIVVESVPARVMELFAVNVLALATVKVPVDAVIPKPLIEV